MESRLGGEGERWGRWLGFLLLVAFLALSALARADTLVPVPPLQGRVTDLTGTLAPATREALTRQLADLERTKGAQVAVLLVPTVGPESVEQYSLRVVEAWKLGRRGVDDGVLLLVAKNDRQARIEVGYGLEGAIPDAQAKRIIEDRMFPLLRQGNFDAGVQAGVSALVSLIQGEPLPPPPREGGAGKGYSWNDLFVSAVMLALVGGGLLRALFGRLVAGLVCGGLMGLLAGLGGLGWLAALGLGVLVFFLVLLGGFFPGGGWGGPGRGGSGWGGGGFSGGGGGFGGGGASGRW